MDAKATLKIQLKPLNELHVRLYRSRISLATRDINTCNKMINWRASCQVVNIISKIHLDDRKQGSRMELHLPHKKETTTPYHHGLSQLRMRGIWGNVCHHPNVEPLLYILYGHIFATKPVNGHLH